MRSYGADSGLLLLALGCYGPRVQLGHRDLAQVHGKARGRRVCFSGRVVELDAVWAARLGVVYDVLVEFFAQRACVHLWGKLRVSGCVEAWGRARTAFVSQALHLVDDLQHPGNVCGRGRADGDEKHRVILRAGDSDETRTDCTERTLDVPQGAPPHTRHSLRLSPPR